VSGVLGGLVEPWLKGAFSWRSGEVGHDGGASLSGVVS
jgi:hypothetical protein